MPAAFPATSLLDDFNRANGAPGANYGVDIEAGEPSLSIVGNTLAQTAAFQSNYWLTQFAESQEAWFTIVSFVTGSNMRLHARLTPNTTSYCITAYDTGDFYLERMSGGSINFLQTLGGTGTLVAGDKLGLRCIGSTIQAFRDSGAGFVQVGTDQTDAVVTGPGFLGVEMSNGTGGAIDNLGGGSVLNEIIVPRNPFPQSKFGPF